MTWTIHGNIPRFQPKTGNPPGHHSTNFCTGVLHLLTEDVNFKLCSFGIEMKTLKKIDPFWLAIWEECMQYECE